MAISKQQNRFCKKVVDFKSDRRETDQSESDRLLMHKMVERERERVHKIMDRKRERESSQLY